MTPAQLTTLRNLILANFAAEFTAKQYKIIATRLNAPTTKPNPTPQPNVPKSLTLGQFLDVIIDADIAAVRALPAWLMDRIERKLAERDRTDLPRYFRHIGPALAAASRTAVQALLAQTEPDPSWPAIVPDVSRAAKAGLPIVSPRDVEATV